MLGRLYALRKLGGVNFAVIQDRAGLTQAVFDSDIEAKVSSIISVTGTVKEEKRASGGAELVGKSIEVIQAPAEELPFDLSKRELKVELPTLLDFPTSSAPPEARFSSFTVPVTEIMELTLASTSESKTACVSPALS